MNKKKSESTIALQLVVIEQINVSSNNGLKMAQNDRLRIGYLGQT